MKRMLVVLAGLLCLSMAGLAQDTAVPYGTALDMAIAEVNARLGTSYSWSGGQIAYQYNTERVAGDNLGCPNVAATNQNLYMQTTARFDISLDGAYEWEYRYAYAANGTLITVVCVVPSQAAVQTQAAATPVVVTLSPTATVPAAGTPSLEPIFGRDGSRILPMQVCGGLKTRLVSGATGRVIPGGVENNLRQSPVLSSPKIGFLNAGEVFVVMDGPFCTDNIAWYLVGDGVTRKGWTAEGVNGNYFIEPVLTNALPIGADNAANLATYGGIFAPGVVSISANWPGGVLVSSGSSLQLWRTLGGFLPLESPGWEPATEFPTPHASVFADNTGNQWAMDLINGNTTALTPLNSDRFSAYTQPNSGLGVIAAVDNESNFAAVVNSDNTTVTLVALGRDGAANTVAVTLPHAAAVRDVAFSADSMRLYVLTAGQITVYAYLMGEGWSAQAQQVVNTDVTVGKLAVDEGGSRVAAAGSTASGASVIRVFNNLNTEVVGDETGVNFDAPAGVTFSKPSFSADGSLVAAHANNGSVALMNTTTGVVTYLPVNNGQPTAGGIAVFSRDGLVLWVGNGANGMQAYAVRAANPQ